MKWTLFELENLHQINGTIESFQVPEGYSDLDSITNVTVSGRVTHTINEVKMNLRVVCELNMLCAYTLKDVHVPLDFELDLIFGPTLDADYELSNPLELDDIILGNILAEKPFRVFHETADPKVFEPKKEVHPAFEELEDLLND